MSSEERIATQALDEIWKLEPEEHEMVDIVTPGGIAVDIKEAVSTLMLQCGPELIGRLVQSLVESGALSTHQLSRMLPNNYKVRE